MFSRPMSRGDAPVMEKKIQTTDLDQYNGFVPTSCVLNISYGMGDYFSKVDRTTTSSSPHGWASFPAGVTFIHVKEKSQSLVLQDNENNVAVSSATEETTSSTQHTGVKKNGQKSRIPEKSMDSGDSTSSTSETHEIIHICVSIAIVKLLTKSRAADIWGEKDLVTYTKRVVQQTMQGLNVKPGYIPDTKDVKKICKTVYNNLEKKYGGKSKLRSAILSEQPREETVIAQCVQACISQHSAGSAENTKNKSSRKIFWETTRRLLFIAGMITILVLFF